ncbi:MAG: GNAT family N-acetyltransferase [bacterium]|nr:GNAT family N-acetyltransferase [bacterium]
MKIEQIHKNSADFQKLKSFVEKHQLTFNSEAWLRIYNEQSIFQCAIFNNNNDVIGCFIYYRFRKSVLKFVITPPFAPDVELFYINPSESVVGRNSFDKEVMTTLAAYFDALHVPYLNLNFPATVIDTQPFTWKGYTAKTRYSYLINLSQGQEELHANLSSEKRKSLNKAEKDGLIIQQTRNHELVYSLIVKSLERNHVAKNLSILRSILFDFADENNSFAFVAYQNNEPAGAAFCIVDGQKAVYLFGGLEPANKHHGAGVSCMWQSIIKAKELGLKWFDFEGSMNASIERYFREFGGTLTPYFCVEKVSWMLRPLLLLKKQ